MAKFSIYQINLTDEQADLINETGDFNAVPAFATKNKMQFNDDRIGGLADEAFEAGYYTHVANITAEDYNDCFEVGNMGPDSNIERLGRMASLSVGDILIHEDGTQVVIASSGFVAIGHKPALAA